MYYRLNYLILCIISLNGLAQNSIDEALNTYNSGSIDYIDVDTLKAELDSTQQLILLDTRAKAEYAVSHIKNAIWVGYKIFDKTKVENIDKNSKVVVYCSIGVRSEDIGEQLKIMGFQNVYNLYGGIFEWVNQGFPVYQNDKQTQNVHAYDKFWGKYLKSGQKVLE